ncbi:MAG: hypothetical protein ACI8VT_002485 [Saprospiraceae bacterium]
MHSFIHLRFLLSTFSIHQGRLKGTLLMLQGLGYQYSP